MGILIGADIVPTEKNEQFFLNGDAKQLIGEDLLNIFNKSSFKIFNLETPLTDVLNPIDKHGPNLAASKLMIEGYKALGVNLFTLANNHIMDQSRQGLDETIDLLKSTGIDNVGAGENLQDAKKPYIFKYKDKKIGIYACAEHEFSIATQLTAGVNPYDPLESFDDVMRLRENCDLVIVLYHGGKEEYRYPSPNLQRVFRKFAECGASLIIAQHTHCVGCKEEYKNATLIYGQGNFLFDYKSNEYWDTSLLLDVDLIDDKFNIKYIPLEKKNGVIRKSNDNKIISDFEYRSIEILQDGFIEKQYDEFAKEMIFTYLSSLRGDKSILAKIMNKVTQNKYEKFKLKNIFKKRNLLYIENIINCECHRELFLKGIEINKYL